MHRYIATLVVGLSLGTASAAAQNRFLCAGGVAGAGRAPSTEAAAKVVRSSAPATGRAIAIFARLRGEESERSSVPSWAGAIFDADRPGSFSHFYETMSFGKLQVSGQVAPRIYESADEAQAYATATAEELGGYRRFATEILIQADRDIDFAAFDNDGPDGVPDSGDDDGVVDAVFIVTASTPTDFIVGRATGAGHLGWEDPFVTDDEGAAGEIIIRPEQGTLQRGRTPSEAIGSMCHEYGHVLGLPDLYNTKFLRTPDAPPEDDSAGIGAWGLMGWGALGWSGDDGPNSFCAWSRARLGWSEVVEPGVSDTTIRLLPVGSGGAIHKVPLTGREYYLLEYRSRSGSYYDRAIPAEGVLIMHAERLTPTAESPTRRRLDLECADGRWIDAGYPIGTQEAPTDGGDNLDFWAHDEPYRESHAGNLGDRTDVFGGVQFGAFTPETNPSSLSNDGHFSVHLEDIRVEDGVAFARVRTRPLVLLVQDIEVIDKSRDGLLVSGEPARVHFTLLNKGGLEAVDITVVLSTDDPLTRIIHDEARVGDLDPEERSLFAGLSEYLEFAISGDFVGSHTTHMYLQVLAGGIPVGLGEATVSVTSPRQVIHSVEVLDPEGNADGAAQPGEFVRLRVNLGVSDAGAALRSAQFRIRSLGSEVLEVGERTIRTRAPVEGLVAIESSEFLLPASLAAGVEVPFVLEADNGFEVWRDTLAIGIAEGGDRTPPRVLGLSTRRVGRDLRIVLPMSQILEGGEPEKAVAIICSAPDSSETARVDLRRDSDAFTGTWRGPAAGDYLVTVEVEDGAGNRGRGKLQDLVISPQRHPAERDVGWEKVGEWGLGTLSAVHDLVISPSHPEVMYALIDGGLIRSRDGGASWERTRFMHGLVGGSGYTSGSLGLFVDSADPGVVYTTRARRLALDPELGAFPHHQLLMRSRDYGDNWEQISTPGSGTNEVVLGTGDGKLYLGDRRKLHVSGDGGDTWRQPGTLPEGWYTFAFDHPANGDVVYAGIPSLYADGAEGPGKLYRSEDGGVRWTGWSLERPYNAITADPRSEGALYAVEGGSVWHSSDDGRRWELIWTADRGTIGPVLTSPTNPDAVYALGKGGGGSPDLWRSLDAGCTWSELSPSSDLNVEGAVVSPTGVVYALAVSGHSMMGVDEPGLLLASADQGQSWQPVHTPEQVAHVGPLGFDEGGTLHAGSLRLGVAGMDAGLYTSTTGGASWEWQSVSSDLSSVSSGVDALLVGDEHPPVMLVHLYTLRWDAFVRVQGWESGWTEVASGMGASFVRRTSYPVIMADPVRSGVYYSADRNVRRSVDHGVTWEGIGVGLPDPGYHNLGLGGLAVAGESPCLYTAVDGCVFRLCDGDAGWKDCGAVDTGSDVLSLASHPRAVGRLYACTSGGLFVSEDGGSSWDTLLRPRMGMWSSGRLRFGAHDPARVFAITGPELYESRDAGATWENLLASVGGRPWVTDVAEDPYGSGAIFVATSQGVYRLPGEGASTAVSGAVDPSPTGFCLQQNYPNPFNSSTVIEFSLPVDGDVDLSVYNLLGQKIRVLAKGEWAAGQHRVTWAGRDDDGRQLATGVYICRLRMGRQAEVRRPLIIR